ncbi:MAG TPA: penicillin-binding transpeptidase domain-containing protein [Candidatus Dojkabacteria bacterium]|nr:penicillin-binding transpeptidase domain-containing protein [Candidatus Dojkabacteria bacterium]
MLSRRGSKDKNIINQSDTIGFVIDTDDFSWRVMLPYALLAFSFVYLVLGAFELQIVKGGVNFTLAKRTNQAQVKTLASRGLIYSSDGIKLATNDPSYSLSLDVNAIKAENENEVIMLLADLLSLDSEELKATFDQKVYVNGERITSSRVTLRNNLTYDQYYAVLSRIEDLSGVILNVEAIRNYHDPLVYSNIVGYLGDPSQADIDKGIYPQSQVGKTGIEAWYDQQLRGKDGLRVEEKEVVSGQSVNYEAFESVPGNNIVLTVDSRWQQYLKTILDESINKNNAFAGAGAIVKSSTGEVMALVTSPSYDNNLFAQGISATEYNKYLNDPKRPLFNRPIALQLPPGSILKVVGATAGLESGVISADTEKLSDRCMDLPGGIVFCEADRSYIGWVNVEEALARSSNLFFCQVMQDLRAKMGYSYYFDIAKSYGLGTKTGIDIPGEASGLIPDESYKLRVVKEPWYIGDECNTVIGQGYVTVTPLQMTMVASAIANGGYLLKPYIVAEARSQEGQVVLTNQKQIVNNLNLSNSTLTTLQDGLRLGVAAGTAGGLQGLEADMMVKTGSSDAGEWIEGKYYSGAHSWVMGCFDYQDEWYCFTVMQQWGGRGYKTVPIMKKFINCVYTDFKDDCKDV